MSSDDKTATEQRILEALDSSLTLWKCKRAVKDEIIKKTKYECADLEESIPTIMEELGLSTQLRNMIYNLHREKDQPPPAGSIAAARDTQPPLPRPLEPLESVNEARIQWELGIAEKLDGLVSQKQWMCRVRASASGAECMEAEAPDGGNEHEPPPPPVRKNKGNSCLFDSNDLLKAIVRIQSPNNRCNLTNVGSWGLVKVQLKSPSFHELRAQFRDLHPSQRQCSVDDEFWSCERFMESRTRVGGKAASTGYVPIARQFAKTGLPAALRPNVWCRILELHLGGKDLNHFQTLTQESQKWEVVTDNLAMDDVMDSVNTEHFFPFEEILITVVSAFTHDNWVRKNMAASQMQAPVYDQESEHFVPPSGVQPFPGFVHYAAPMCYLFQRPEPFYYVFRCLWCRYFCKLNCIRSQPETLLPLCRLFENLLQSRDAQLYFHLCTINVNPLQIAFPWIQFAFSSYLGVEQTLILWDRILGFDSLNILPVLAAAMFSFRSTSLMAAESAEEVQEIFANPGPLQVVPLLQSYLFL
jgi:hypothetical protein